MRKKVVVTGIGLVTPIGVTKTEITSRLMNAHGASFSRFSLCSEPHPPVNVFPVPSQSEHSGSFDPVIRFGLDAVRRALDDAELTDREVATCNTGIVVSSSKGGVGSFARYSQAVLGEPLHGSSAFRLHANLAPDCLSGWIARKWKVRGPVKNIVTACATGTHSIIAGVRMIEDGDIKRCIVGASDASIDPLMLSGYQRLGVYAKEMIRPFDARRDGFLVGEGAGILILEEEESAQCRGAAIYGRVDGYIEGQETAGALHFPDRNNTLSELLRRLCRMHAISHVDYINAHATGTKAGDLYESQQIKKAFTDAASIPISSTKSFTGHMLGASGAVEAGFCLFALKNNFIPPTLSLEKADQSCGLDYVPLHARKKRLRRVLSISMGFGGQIGILLLGER
jgi:3-oxoacyl-[acyl-carrier-protein] synthase II